MGSGGGNIYASGTPLPVTSDPINGNHPAAATQNEYEVERENEYEVERENEYEVERENA